MKPDYERAAIMAMETLISNNITTTPVIPLPVFKSMKGVGVLSFTELSNMSNMDRQKFVSMLGGNLDAITIHIDHPKMKYIVGYNQRMPFYMLQRGLARELGHIVLGHDGSRLPEDIRMEEAFCFAHHFLCPRPIVHAIQQSRVPLTTEVLGNMTGCYEQCLAGMRTIPGVHVPAELNRKVRDQFSACLADFLELQSYLIKSEHCAIADFGTFMDGYEE